MPNNTEKTVPHGITFTGIISISGCAKWNTGSPCIPIPHISIGSSSNTYVGVNASASDIVIKDNYNLSGYDTTYVTLEYYK